MPVTAVAADANAVQQDAARRETRGGNIFTKKYGPLPGWGWSLLVAGGAVAYIIWRKRSAAQAATGTAVSDTSTTGTGFEGQIAALQSEIDQLQGQMATSGTATTSTTSTGGTTSGGGGGGGGGGGHATKTPAPSGLHVIRETKTTATVGWKAPHEGGPAGAGTRPANTVIDHYRVRLSNRHWHIAPGHTHTFTGMVAKSHHSWQVQAHSAAGGYSESATGQFTTK